MTITDSPRSDRAILNALPPMPDLNESVKEAGSLRAFFATTGRSDQLYWLLRRLKVLTREEETAFATKCARFALDAVKPAYPKIQEKWMREAMQTAKDYLDGKASAAAVVKADSQSFNSLLAYRRVNRTDGFNANFGTFTAYLELGRVFVGTVAALASGRFLYDCQSGGTSVATLAEKNRYACEFPAPDRSGMYHAEASASAAAYNKGFTAAFEGVRDAARKVQADWLREIVTPERFAEALQNFRAE